MRKYLFCICLFYLHTLTGFEPILILSGPPGAGKGTFSQYCKEYHGYNHLSAGDTIRQEILHKTPLGLMAEEIVARGDFMPQYIMHCLIGEKIKHLVKENKPLIIDGFVRSYEDAIFLDSLLKELGLIDRALEIVLEAPNNLCQKRIKTRLVCNKCTHVYNEETAPSPAGTACHICFSPLNKRINDTEEVIKKRISEYRENIESYQMHKALSYPHLSLTPENTIENCLKLYKDLLKEIQTFDGSSDSFMQNYTQ